MSALQIETITGGPFMENCFLVAHEATTEALLIDPGDDADRIQRLVAEKQLNISAIVCTHAHVDHVGAVAPLQRILGAPFMLHPKERPWLQNLPRQAAMFGLGVREIPTVDQDLEEGATISIGNCSATVIFTPGHTEGGCSLYFESEGVIFVGDTLIAGSVGRTDLPGGSSPLLLRSIKEKLLTLPDGVVIYSGHGPSTTIGEERLHNPFLQPGAPLW